MARCPAPLALATNAFPTASVVSAGRTMGGQQDLGASAVTAPGSAGRVGDPLRPRTPRTVRVRPWP